MADDSGLKSSYELAMERLKKKDADAGKLALFVFVALVALTPLARASGGGGASRKSGRANGGGGSGRRKGLPKRK